MKVSEPIKVGIAGLGAVGLPVARYLDGTDLPLELAAVSASSRESAEAKIKGLKHKPVICPVEEIGEHCDIVLECLPPAHFRPMAEAVLRAGKTLMVLSATQLLLHWDLVDIAKQSGGRIIIPTGALLGLDTVRAAACGNLQSVKMVTRKPPRGLAKAPFVKEQGIDLSDLKEPLRLYQGHVRDAAQKFPANVNVSVALALAGLGPDATDYEVWADPAVTRNIHSIEVVSDSVLLSMTIENFPTEENPATGKVTPLSAIAALKGLVETLKVGT